MFTIRSKMIAEQQRLEKELESIHNKIGELPDGKLICVHNGDYIKWHQSDEHKITYIPKKNRKLAEQLAMKKYLCLKEAELVKEQAAIHTYLQQCKSENKAEELYEIPEYAELLLPFGTPESQELQEWMQAPYTRNPICPEQLVHKTNSGILVRSKSEAIITMLLHMYKIPFRYECALQLGESSKLRLYMANEIFPSIQLITTHETKDQPLDSAFVEMLIKYYFL